MSHEWWKRKAGLDLEQPLASVGAEVPSQLSAVHDERLSRFAGTKIAAVAMDLGCNEVCEADIAELMRHEFSPDGVWENAFCLDRVEAALGEAGMRGQEADLDERDHTAQDERLDGEVGRD